MFVMMQQQHQEHLKNERKQQTGAQNGTEVNKNAGVNDGNVQYCTGGKKV